MLLVTKKCSILALTASLFLLFLPSLYLFLCKFFILHVFITWLIHSSNVHSIKFNKETFFNVNIEDENDYIKYPIRCCQIIIIGGQSIETMDVLTNYMENSSIHGVGFISKTKAFRRAFWLFVVLTGFTGAFIIIFYNFQNWAETPVITTMETLPISELKFPRVTICPPPNTYTNLNYDLMKSGNRTMKDEVKNEPSILKDTDAEVHTKIDGMITDLLGRIVDSEYKQALKLYFEEGNKYINWYHGYSQELETKWGWFDASTVQSIYSSAASGSINTPGFGKPFDISYFINPKTLHKHKYKVILDFSNISKKVVELHVNINIALHRKEKVTYEICGDKLARPILVSGKISFTIQCQEGRGNKCVRKYNEEICKESNVEFILQRRNYNQGEINVAMLKNMTGMNVTWNYSHNLSSSEQTTFVDQNKKFIQLANIYNKYGSKVDIRKEIKQFQVNSLKTFLDRNKDKKIETITNDFENAIDGDRFLNDMKNGLEKININNVSIITDEKIYTAGNMYTYLVTEPTDLWMNSIFFFFSSLGSESLRETLLLISNYDPQNHFQGTVKKILLNILFDHLGFEFLNIDNKTILQDLINNQSITGELNTSQITQ